MNKGASPTVRSGPRGAAVREWRPIESAPKFQPLLGWAKGVSFSMMWRSNPTALNAAIKKYLPGTPPLETSPAGWCVFAYGMYCRKPDGTWFFVEPSLWQELPPQPADRTEQSEAQGESRER